MGTTTLYPEVHTILEIGGQDSKIILVENGVSVDYAMNTLCTAGTGAFLSSQARRLGIEVEDMGVVHAFEELLNCPILVDENGHLMGAMGAAILARRSVKWELFDFSVGHMEFVTREADCGRSSNNCEIICVYRDGVLIDSWWNRCERGAVHLRQNISAP